MIRLSPDLWGRMYHAVLHQRMVHFAKVLTPELPAEPIVSLWLSRFYTGDPYIQILINADEKNQITAHALLEIQSFNNVPMVITCHQFQNDEPNIHQIDELVEYCRKLRNEINASCLQFFTVRGVDAYEKRYGFKATRVVMLDYDGMVKEE